MMPTYTHEKSQEWYQRATEVIPGGIYGHLGPAEGCFMPISSYPLFAAKAQGSYFWDVDGNKYLDLMCAYGPMMLGYNDPDVDKAAMDQLKVMNCVVQPGTLMVELAELMVDTVDMADWAFFAKNGGDVTNYALMVARAATGRDKFIAMHGGYHGIIGWTQGWGAPGVAKSDVADKLMVPFNDVSAVEKIVSEYKGEIAALISTPYYHPVFDDNRLPEPEYWNKIRHVCDREGIVLIIDDVRCGFRLDVRGSDAHYGFKADLECFCKALANGYNISALCGIDSLKDAAASVMATGSYWMSAEPMAAAKACVTKLREIDSAKVCTELGLKLTGRLQEVAGANGFDFRISGEPSMFFMRTAGLESKMDPNFLLHQAWVSECVKRGVFMTNHHNHFINCSLTEADIDFVGEVADEAFKVVKQRSREILAQA